MDKRSLFKKNQKLLELYDNFQEMNAVLSQEFKKNYNRLPSLPDLYSDRWERAKRYNFGKNTNIYDNSLIIGDVHIGKECWIGPNTIIDGSGGLKIGNYCTISAGVQIYTHDNIKQTLSSKEIEIEKESVIIGNNVYISPNSIITKGVSIGNNIIIGAFSFVDKDIEDNSVVYGQPTRLIRKLK